MDHIYELNVNQDNKLTLKYVNQFKSYNDYRDNVYNKYNIEQEMAIDCMFTEDTLMSFINEVNENVKPNIDSDEIKYYGFSSEYAEIHEIGAFNSKKEFLEYYYADADDTYAFDDSLASDYVFYFTYDSIQDVIIHFKDIINTKNITSNEVVQFDDYLSSFDNELKLK